MVLDVHLILESYLLTMTLLQIKMLIHLMNLVQPQTKTRFRMPRLFLLLLFPTSSAFTVTRLGTVLLDRALVSNTRIKVRQLLVFVVL